MISKSYLWLRNKFSVLSLRQLVWVHCGRDDLMTVLSGFEYVVIDSGVNQTLPKLTYVHVTYSRNTEISVKLPSLVKNTYLKTAFFLSLADFDCYIRNWSFLVIFVTVLKKKSIGDHTNVVKCYLEIHEIKSCINFEFKVLNLSYATCLWYWIIHQKHFLEGLHIVRKVKSCVVTKGTLINMCYCMSIYSFWWAVMFCINYSNITWVKALFEILWNHESQRFRQRCDCRLSQYDHNTGED